MRYYLLFPNQIDKRIKSTFLGNNINLTLFEPYIYIKLHYQ